MLFLLQQFQEFILILLVKLFQKKFSIFIGILYPSDKPIYMHLHQPRLVNNPG